MKLSHIALSVVLVAVTGAASAQGTAPNRWFAPFERSNSSHTAELLRQYGGDATPQRSSISRAEVLADVAVYRASGLSMFERGEASYGHESETYKQAKARYQRMRSAPEFANLVKAIAEERGETVTASAGSATIVQ